MELVAEERVTMIFGCGLAIQPRLHTAQRAPGVDELKGRRIAEGVASRWRPPHVSKTTFDLTVPAVQMSARPRQDRSGLPSVGLRGLQQGTRRPTRFVRVAIESHLRHASTRLNLARATG